MGWNYQGNNMKGRKYEEDYSGNVARFDERVEIRGRRGKLETLDMESLIHGWGDECKRESYRERRKETGELKLDTQTQQTFD